MNSGVNMVGEKERREKGVKEERKGLKKQMKKSSKVFLSIKFLLKVLS